MRLPNALLIFFDASKISSPPLAFCNDAINVIVTAERVSPGEADGVDCAVSGDSKQQLAALF